MLGDLQKRALDIGLDLTFDKSVAKMIAKTSAKQANGARSIRSNITHIVEDKLSDEYLSETLPSSEIYVNATADDSAVIFYALDRDAV